jgi:hypothetical protein
MLQQQLLDYIGQQTKLGKSTEEITTALIGVGWKPEDINQAFAAINSGTPLPTSSELPRAKQLLSESWTIYKNRFKTLIAIILIPAACYLVLILLAAIISVIVAALLKQSSLIVPVWIVIGILAIVAVIFLIYMYVWAAVAQLYAIKDRTESISWKEAFKRSRPKINPFFSTNLLSGLAVLGGLILLIVPGIIFGLWFSLAPYVVIEEGLTNTAALNRSKYYVKGRIGQIFGKLFYVGIITLGLYIGLAIVLSLFGALTGIKYNDLSWINNIFGLIWAPLVTVYAYQVYKSSKATRP